jgi:hypothetical protein
MAKWQTQEDSVNNVYCYISRKGDDVSGDGSQANPFYSVNKGVEYLEGLTTSLQRVLVMGAGLYYDESITVTRANSILFLGEPNVLIDGSGTNALQYFRFDILKYLKIDNYATPIIPDENCNYAIIDNCVISNSYLILSARNTSIVSLPKIYNSVFFDVSFSMPRYASANNVEYFSTFISNSIYNCIIRNILDSDSQVQGSTVKNNIFKNTVLSFGSGEPFSLNQSIIKNNCFVGNMFYYNGIYYTLEELSTTFINLSESNISNDPMFVDVLSEDFALQSNSPCLYRGEGGTHIGAKSIGFSYDGDSVELTTAGGALLTNLQVTSGVLHRIDDTQDGELTTARMGDGILRIFQTASLMATLGYDANGYINKAIDNDNDLTEASQQLDFEIVYGNDLADYQANETADNWKSIVWNSNMKVDGSGYGTGNNNHDFNDSEFIQMAYWKLRMKFRNV